ncbi:MAG: hypothetical protein JW841_13265 [Deltaproteobacteria bacterium]|nr:hypothetical protein [Deltaproteobacteria bacterium]
MQQHLEDALEFLAEKKEIVLRSSEDSWSGPQPVVCLIDFSSQDILDDMRSDGLFL